MTIEELASRENAIRGIPYVVFVLITHMAEHCMRLLPPTCSVASAQWMRPSPCRPLTALDLEGVFRISVAFPDLLEMKEMLETGTSPKEPRAIQFSDHDHV